MSPRINVHSANRKPLMVCYLTSFLSNIVSVTIFEIFAAEIPDLDLGRFKAIQGQSLRCQSIAHGWFPIRLPLTQSLLRPGRGAVCCDEFVCLSAVSTSISLDRWTDLHDFLCRSLWPWLGPPLAALRCVMYFQFYVWRHVWPHWAVRRCVEGWTFNLLSLAVLRYRAGVWCLWCGRQN